VGISARRPSAAALALIFAALGYGVVFPLLFYDDNYALVVASNAAMAGFISLGVWITFAIGRINISQGAFALIGGYATAILSARYGVSFWLCLPLSGLAAALIGVVIGAPVLRLKGVYFAMITLCLTKAANLAFLNGGEFTGEAGGIVGIARPGALEVFEITLIPDFAGRGNLPFFFLSAALLFIGALFVWRLSRCRLGWIFRSLRQNEELAASIGVHVAKYRVMAFAASCFFGGVGGAVFAALQQNVFPSTYTVNDSVFYMLYCFLGGLEYVLGPVIGAFLLVVGFEFLHEFNRYQALIYGVLMIVMMLALPNGLLSLSRRAR
jgi:branched-chain amino acid transport system permease protein